MIKKPGKGIFFNVITDKTLIMGCVCVCKWQTESRFRRWSEEGESVAEQAATC